MRFSVAILRCSVYSRREMHPRAAFLCVQKTTTLSQRSITARSVPRGIRASGFSFQDAKSQLHSALITLSNMQTITALQEFSRQQPRRYQSVPTILKRTADNLAYTVPSVCGSKNPKIREITVKVDFKGATPVATVGSRYYRKWTKSAKFATTSRDELNFTPVVGNN